ncbi:hypothetical protein DPEC_G00223360 [Dallia pectoralis]|uniref:Uncharacterized protein n=1 Tax=Dallia pectoralis TaxID=75939 RepID=A0ACC2G016_DALPE|nr:hypothetical protein DPEC_G00223360 [Dallia pectoralis]
MKLLLTSGSRKLPSQQQPFRKPSPVYSDSSELAPRSPFRTLWWIREAWVLACGTVSAVPVRLWREGVYASASASLLMPDLFSARMAGIGVVPLITGMRPIGKHAGQSESLVTKGYSRLSSAPLALHTTH